MKLSHAITGFWLEKQLAVSKNTVKSYDYVFRRFGLFLNDMDIEQVTSVDVRRFLSHIANTLGASWAYVKQS